MAICMAGNGRRRDSWMGVRARLGRDDARSMAFGLVEPLGYFYRRAKDHAP
jgi:hypothetical protein